MKKINYNVINITSTLVLFSICCFILFIPPQIGVANSGDFGRIIANFGLYYLPDYSNFNHFYDTFSLYRPDNAASYGGYIATTSLFLFFAMLVNSLYNNLFDANNYFYIYSLSSIYLIFYVLTFFLLIKNIESNVRNKYLLIILIPLSILIFSDSLFIEFFNSFFQEASYIVIMLFFIVCFLNYKSFILDSVLLTLVICSKEQYLLYSILFILIFMKYGFSYKKLMAVVSLFCIPLYIYTNVNTYSKSINLVSSLFGGSLHSIDSDHASTRLSAINLNPDYKIFAGEGYWGLIGRLNNSNDENEKILFSNAINNIKRTDIIKLYLYNPFQMFNNYLDYLQILIKNGPFPPNLGNYKLEDGEKFRVKAFTMFSYLLKNIHYVFMINILFCFLLIFLSYKVKSNFSLNLILIIFLNMISFMAIPVYIFGTGFDEEVKHVLDVYYNQGLLIILNIYQLILFYEKHMISKNPKNKINKINKILKV